MVKKQLFYPQASGLQEIPTIRGMGLAEPEQLEYRRGASWSRGQVYQNDTFLLQLVESYSENDVVSHIRQEDYIKFNFWLEGKHTTVLDGFGRHEHSHPQVLITAGPQSMVKRDLANAGRSSWVALCVLREFFAAHMELDPHGLPSSLRAVVLPQEAPFTLRSVPLTADMTAAARAALAAPSAVRQSRLYTQSKAIELMSLLIGHMTESAPPDVLLNQGRGRQMERLHAARELLARRYAEPLGLGEIAVEIGMSKTALTMGFRRLFGESVFEYLHAVRMQRAYDLLQCGGITIEQVAQAVGYPHACNFSTAFRAHFGCQPKAVLIH